MRRPSTRLAFIRAAIPVFHRRPATPSDGLLQGPLIERPETALGTRDDDGDEAAGAKNPRRRGGLLGLFSRKRKQRSPSPSPQVVLNVPLTIHFLFVGDKSAGQTSLLFRARYGQFPDDTSGAPDLNTVERLSYVQWDAIFLCFDIQQKPTMHTILQWWLEAVQGGFLAKQQTEVLLHLVGLKKDARDKCTDPRHRVPCPFDSDDFVPYPTCCVIPSDCSAMTGEGVDGMLEDAARESTKRAIDMARFMQMAHPNKRRMF
ncbi:rho-related protein racL [Trichoderma asperellum]|uniref:Rho-related protein racL n=1 Tax=Trichoderma asperellum TaxID=101201 RepID=A0A6V8R7A5_TRIAP|nr:rho-related protein racL [Trichoderma asperellum]